MSQPLSEQAMKLEELVSRLPPASATPKNYAELMELAREIPYGFFTAGFVLEVALKFNVPEKQVRDDLDPQKHTASQVPFDDLVPKTGWLHDYIDYTKFTEPPTVFHFFAAMCVIGVTLGRRLVMQRGSGDIFPNVNVVLVAPAGKCKKTTACNLAVSLYRSIGGNILADKLTPEALVDAFKTMAAAQGLIYAAEWAAFLGRQQYMEGMVPMLTALFDCPAVWSSATIMRGATQLQNVSISHLAATTIDWMQTSVTRDAMAGGFMSRLLFIVQHDTPRSFPFPPPLDPKARRDLTDRLAGMQHCNGTVGFAKDAYEWYAEWYVARKTSTVERHFAGYFERKPDRMLQIAMVLNASVNPRNYTLSLETLQQAKAILDWIETYLPGAFSELSQSQIGDDQSRLLKQLRAHAGIIKHSEWLRMNTSRMNGRLFKEATQTLIDAKMVAYDESKHMYYLLPGGML
jgi:hypothetical protein